MTKDEIKVTLEKYYKKKWGIARGLFIFLIVVVIAALFNAILSIYSQFGHTSAISMTASNITAVTGVIAYILLFIYVIKAALFPTGKYSLHEDLQRKDIVSVLEYISEMNCGYNEQYDHLLVLSRTAQNMVSNIYNWGTDAEEGRLNSAWNLLNRYFKEITVQKIDISNLKKYANELLSQLGKAEIKEDVLIAIMRQPQGISSFKADVKLPKQKHPVSIEFKIYVLCTIALFVIVIFKSVAFWNPNMEQSKLMDYLQTIGSDIIAIVFAAFSIKACWLNTHIS